MESLQWKRMTCQCLLQTELGQKGTGAAPQPDPFQTKTSSVPGGLAQGGGGFAGSVRPAHHSLLASLRSPTLPDLVITLLFVA